MITVLEKGETGPIRERLTEELFEHQRSRRHLCIPIGNDAYFFAFRYCDVANAARISGRMSVYCSDSEMILSGGTQKIGSMLSKIPEDRGDFFVMAEFLSELVSDDVDILEKYECEINLLELRLLESAKPEREVSLRIKTMSRELLQIKRYYEQLDLAVDRLVENENGVIPQRALIRLRSLDRLLGYLLRFVGELRENITQVREAYQETVDIEQNEIMKAFTVITAVFMPLTLIAGWYGMNLAIPEFSWKYGYPFVVVISIAVCAVCFIIFKKKRWF